jgi:hypothetical protein
MSVVVVDLLDDLKQRFLPYQLVAQIDLKVQATLIHVETCCEPFQHIQFRFGNCCSIIRILQRSPHYEFHYVEFPCAAILEEFQAL